MAADRSGDQEGLDPDKTLLWRRGRSQEGAWVDRSLNSGLHGE